MLINSFTDVSNNFAAFLTASSLHSFSKGYKNPSASANGNKLAGCEKN